MSKIANALERAKRMRNGQEPAPAEPRPAAPSPSEPRRPDDRRHADQGPQDPNGERRRTRPSGGADRRRVDIGPPPGLLDRRSPVPVQGNARGSVTDALLETRCRLISFVKDRPAHLERNKVVTFCPDHRAIDACNFIRTRVLEQTREKKLNTLLVTSVNPGEGKTLTAINLALSISREAKQTALLVEANLRRPAVSERLGLSSACEGLTEYLFHDLDLSDLLINPGLGSMLRVILAGAPTSGSTDLFSLPKMQLLVRELKARYDDRYIIFDGPHLKGMPDAHILASYVDGVILVMEARRTSRYDLAHVLESLRGKTIVGIIMNRGPQL